MSKRVDFEVSEAQTQCLFHFLLPVDPDIELLVPPPIPGLPESLYAPCNGDNGLNL